MRERWFFLLGLVSGCVAEPPYEEPPPPTPPWDMIRIRTMAGALPMTGIDTDGAGGLWLAYYLRPGSAAPVDNLRIAHVDASGAQVAEFRYTIDELWHGAGLAFSGDALWLANDDTVREIDPETGAMRSTRTVECCITDLEVDHTRGELILASWNNRIIALDLATGQETWRAQLWPDEPGYVDDLRAIALADDGRLWVGRHGAERFDVFDAAHQWLTSYSSDANLVRHTADTPLYMAWDATTSPPSLIAAHRDQIMWVVNRPEMP